MKILIFAFCCACLFSGCVRLPLKHPTREPRPLPEKYSSKLTLPESPLRVISEKPMEDRGTYQISRVEIVSFIPAYGTNSTVTVEVYSRAGVTNMPVILVLPISAGKDYPLERKLLASYFIEHGYAVVLVYREDIKIKEFRDIDHVVDEIDGASYRAVVFNQRVLDWIESRPDFDRDRIAVVGTSMGAIKGALLAAVDDRVKASVLVLAGCDAPYILAHTKDGALRWAFRGLFKKKAPRKSGAFGRREQLLEKHNRTKAELQSELEGRIIWDPKYLASSVDPENVLLVLASCDAVVPFSTGLELRREMGKPATIFVLGGHYVAAAYMLHLRKEALEFIESTFSK